MLHRSTRRFVAGLLVSFAALAGGASAASYDDALTAYYKKDYDTALRLYRQLADKGDPRAQRDLGRMYLRGEGVSKDADEARKWSALAKEQDDALAAYNHGDFEMALRVFRPLAEKGQVLGQYLVGLMYANGQGVAESYQEGLKWLQKAAEQGEAKAQFSVGVIYFKGLGVPRNFDEAFKWYSRSANQGYATAQYNAANMYARGRGTGRDPVTAYMFYSMAAAHGIRPAFAAKDRLEKSMSAEQIAEAQKKLRDWAPKPEN